MSTETENLNIQAAKEDMPFIARILENIREVIAYDKQQKQPIILRINEAFILKLPVRLFWKKIQHF